MSRPEEHLTVTIEEWTLDGKTIVEVLGRLSNVVLARRAFDAARGLRPWGRIIVRDRALVIADSAELAARGR